MLLVFFITFGGLLLVTISSVVVMKVIQYIYNQFIEQDLPRLEQTKTLNSLIEKIALDASQLTHAQTKSSLNKNYDHIDDLLITLENTGNSLSQNKVNAEILEMLLLAQQIRSETQLSFQLIEGFFRCRRRNIKT